MSQDIFQKGHFFFSPPGQEPPVPVQFFCLFIGLFSKSFNARY